MTEAEKLKARIAKRFRSDYGRQMTQEEWDLIRWTLIVCSDELDRIL